MRAPPGRCRRESRHESLSALSAEAAEPQPAPAAGNRLRRRGGGRHGPLRPGIAVEFRKGRGIRSTVRPPTSLERPAGPVEETVLARLMADPAVQAFSPLIDRRIRLEQRRNGPPAGDRSLSRPADPSAAGPIPSPRKRPGHPPDPFAFLLEENAILVDEQLAAQLRLHAGQLLETSRGTFRIVGTFPNASGEPLILMDIGHAQRLFELSGKIDRVDLIVNDEADFLSRWKSGFRIQSGRQRQETLQGYAAGLPLEPPGPLASGPLRGDLPRLQHGHVHGGEPEEGCGHPAKPGGQPPGDLRGVLLRDSSPGVHRRGPGRAGRLPAQPLSEQPGRGNDQQSIFFPPPGPPGMVLVGFADQHRAGVRGKRSGGDLPPGRTDPGGSGAGPPGPDRGSRHEKALPGKRPWPGRGFGDQPRSVQPGRDSRLFRICRLFCPFDRGQPDCGACPGPGASASEEISRPPVRAPGESRRREHPPEPRPYGGGRGRLHGGDFHVDRAQLHDRELPPVSRLVDGHPASGRSFHRESR